MTPDVPTLIPTEATWKIGWEAVEAIVDQPQTVRIRRHLVDISDGTPVTVSPESSTRGEIVVTTDRTTDQVFVLLPHEKLRVLERVIKLADQCNMNYLVERPFLVESEHSLDLDTVRWLVLRWRAFTRWFLSVAALDFDELKPLMADLPFRNREGGLQFLRCVAAIVPTMTPYEDVPQLLLRL